MQKVLALSTLQSLVNEHSGMIYHEALDCIKKEIADSKNPVVIQCVANKYGSKCKQGFSGTCGIKPCKLLQWFSFP